MALFEMLTGYKTVAASQTNQILGNSSGGKGDILQRLIIIPATTSPGAVSIKDGSNAAITIFVGGTVVDISSFHIEIGSTSEQGAWQITTGANVSVIAVGRFK